MKISIFILIAIFFSFYAEGQQNIFKNKPWEDFKKKELLNQKLKQMIPAINNNFSQLPAGWSYRGSVLKIPLTGTFIKNTGKGTDLYVINSYHMPCVVPDKTFKSNMPVAGYYEAGKNPFLLSKESEEK